MSRDPGRDELGIIVSIDSAQKESYEIVGSRKVEKDVYELVLAKPSAQRKRAVSDLAPVTVQGLNSTAELSDAVLIHEGDHAATTTPTPPTNGKSAISSTWVVRTPRGVTPGVSPNSGSRGSVAPVTPQPIDRLTEPPAVSLAEAPSEVKHLEPEPLKSKDLPTQADTSVESESAEPPDKREHRTAPDSLREDVGQSSSSPSAAPGTPSTPDPASPHVRVAPREVTSAPERPRPTPTSPVAKAAPMRPSSVEEPTNPSPQPVKKVDSKDPGRRLFGFGRGKDAALTNPPVPVRAAPATRPHVDIDPRTGRPVGAVAAGPVDARRPSPEVPVVDASKGSRRGRASENPTEAVGEVRAPNDFQKKLVEKGLVTDEQLDEAFQRHLRSRRHLFECLDEMGIVDEDTLATEVSEFYGLPLCNLPREELEPSALDLVPEQVAREHMVFPVWLSPEGLFVAVTEPSERLAGLLTQASGQTVTMAIAKASDVRWAIDSNYHALADVADLVQEFEFSEGGRKKSTTTTSPADTAAESAPIVQVVNRILSQAIRDGASDVHIEPSDDIVRVRNRVDGVLKVVLVLPAAMGLGLVSRIKIMADMNIVERRRPQDGKFTTVIDGKEVDVRVATVATIWGETCVLRILDKTRSVLGINDLGMTPDTHAAYSRLIRSPFGMVLCVGPTGSGKTTTLYASLTEISDVARNVMTIEDPVEYVFPSINQIQTNEQAGLTFATGLKSILRQDSDIVLVGEIRDVETARIAVQSTLTGHFVLSSLHATDAISALTRFIDMGIEPFLIASSVIAIVGQRLVRRTCSSCKTPYEPSDEEMAFYERGGGPAKTVFYHGAGCNFCGHTGFKDRVGVYELFPMTQDMKRLVVGFATEDEIREMARKQGMRTIQDEAVSLIAADLTTSAEVVRSIYSI